MFYCDGKMCGFIVIEVYLDSILRNYIYHSRSTQESVTSYIVLSGIPAY